LSEIAEIFDALKLLQTSNIITLRDLLQNEYSAEWTSKNIDLKSLSKTISRKLEVLVEMNLVKKEKIGKENIYTIINNYPVQSNAPKLMQQLTNIFKQDKALFAQAQKPIEELMNEIKSPYYIRQSIENISSKENIISLLEHSINEFHYINIQYKEKSYKVKPLKIAEFEGIWYFLLFFDKDKTYRKFRLIEIDKVEVLKDTFYKSQAQDLKISKWHNVWHNPNKKPSRVTLWIAQLKVKYFYQKNIFDITSYPKRVKECDDGIEYTVYITHESEILSELMYWQPNVIILEEDGELDIIKKLQDILNEMVNRQKNHQ
jgi:predicted transcriptional regulator